MNAKLCKKMRQFLRLTEVPHSKGTIRGAEHPAGTFEREYSLMKRAAKCATAAEKHAAFPNFLFPVK